MSQNQTILKHLKQGLSITPKFALFNFGCFRLAARIKDLRNQGHAIKTVMIEQGDKKFAKYYLTD